MGAEDPQPLWEPMLSFDLICLSGLGLKQIERGQCEREPCGYVGTEVRP
jgi:hypothetical protein